jgi:hypothetical protein
MTRKKVTDYVDTNKIDTEKVKERAAEAAALLSDVSSKAATQAGAVAAQAKDRASNAKDWAQPRVSEFIAWLTPRAEKAWQDSLQAAAPQVEKAAGKAAPLIDTAHDKLVDDLLPKMVSAFNAAASNAASAQSSALAAAAAAEKASKKSSKKGWLVALAAGGAAAAGYVFWKRAQPQTDPWAEPWEQGTGADYTDGAARHSSGVGSAAGSAVAKGKEAGAKAAQTAKDLGVRAYSAAGPAFEAAKEKAGPVLEKAAPVLDAAKEKAAPVFDAAWATAQKASTAAQKRGGNGDPVVATPETAELGPTETTPPAEILDEPVRSEPVVDPLVDEVPPADTEPAGEKKQEG